MIDGPGHCNLDDYKCDLCKEAIREENGNFVCDCYRIAFDYLDHGLADIPIFWHYEDIQLS